MNRTQNIIYNIITLFFLNVLFFISNIYPRHIIEFDSSGIAISAIVLNLIYFLIYFLFLSVFVSKGRSFYSANIFQYGESLRQKLCLNKIAMLFLLQITIETVQLLFFNYTGSAIYLFYDILIIINWCLIFKILTYKEDSLSKNKKLFWVVILLAILSISVCFVIDYNIITELNNTHFEKTSIKISFPLVILPKHQQVLNNEFLHTIVTFVLDTILGSLSILYIMSGKNKGSKCNTPRIFWLRAFILLAGLLVSVCIMFGIKYLISPNGTLEGVNIHTTSTASSDGMFSGKIKTVTVSRHNTSIFEGFVYNSRSTKIYYKTTQDENEKKIATVVLDKYPDVQDSYEIEGDTLIIPTFFDEYNINSKPVYVYRNCVICYEYNGEPTVIEFNNISFQSENNILINVCKQMIEAGNIVAFEYSCDYLYKYDKEFILPYIERYSNENFNKNELQYIYNFNYNSKYIADIATDLTAEQ